jgi:hypothetical protein
MDFTDSFALVAIYLSPQGIENPDVGTAHHKIIFQLPGQARPAVLRRKDFDDQERGCGEDLFGGLGEVDGHVRHSESSRGYADADLGENFDSRNATQQHLDSELKFGVILLAHVAVLIAVRLIDAGKIFLY